MLRANDLYGMSVADRNSHIMGAVNRIGGNVEGAKSLVINEFIAEYIAIKRHRDGCMERYSFLNSIDFNNRLSGLINHFFSRACEKIRNSKPSYEEVLASSKNIYELSGAVNLASCNKVSRELSTILGLLWERVAEISPYVISTESEFGIKIQGVDIIAQNFETYDIEYLQMKTQKNTLTGSQNPRVDRELGLHINPVFCACFDTNASWTFNNVNIPRRCGAEFWSQIGIDYNLILNQVVPLIQRLDSEYINT